MNGFKKVAAMATVFCALIAQNQAAHADLDKIQKLGSLKVAVYKDLAPFSDEKGGIDVDIANALAAKLGVKLSLLPFPADEDLNDDLRNMVWKGHFLGYGPADVMLHVPVDNFLMAQNKNVKIFAPYYRERVRLVRNVRQIPQCESIDCLTGKRIGVEKVSIGAMVLLGEQNGKFQNNTRIYETTAAAVAAMKASEVDAVLGPQSALEAGTAGDANYAITDANFGRLPRQGWVVGMAVKDDNVELAKALQQATNELFDSGEMNKIFAKYGVNLVKP